MTGHLIHCVSTDAGLLGDAVTDQLGALGSPATEHIAADKATLWRVNEAISTADLFGGDRVVVIDDATKLGDDIKDLLASWATDPAAGIKVICAWTSKPPKKLVANATVIDASAPRSRSERTTFATKRFAAEGIKLDRGAVTLVVDRCGEEPMMLRAIAQTMAAAGITGPTSAAAVTPYLPSDGDLPPWALTDALDTGNVNAALGAALRMLDAGRNAHQLLASLRKHYEVRHKLALVGDHGADAVCSEYKLHGFVATKARDAARRANPDRCGKDLERVLAASADLKGGSGLDERTIMTILTARLATR